MNSANEQSIKISTDDKSEFGLSVWQYFSDRSDQSANYLRAVLFASANAGLGFCLLVPADFFRNEISQLRYLSILVLIPVVCFGFCIRQIISSWELQKTKSVLRRKLAAQKFKQIKKISEREAIKISEELMEKFGRKHSLRNSSVDDCSVSMLCLAYFSLVIVTIIFTAVSS